MKPVIPQKELLEKVLSVLSANKKTRHVVSRSDNVSFELLAGDGSNRCFRRFQTPDFSCIAVTPGSGSTIGLKEARSAYHIGSHLFECGVPVPEMFGHDDSCGLILYEDLGSLHLYDIAAATDFNEKGQLDKLKKLYHDVLENLARMQVRGKDGLQENWCWDTSHYDRKVMLERESGYFLQAFWKNFLHQENIDDLEKDFALLAEKSSEPDNGYFLHRDFQSRNIMVKDGRVRFIDFQGGRKGPLGYDPASLLIDPYSSLPHWLQDELLDYYIGCLEKYINVEPESFKLTYCCLALQRNLQIIGAFSYLSKECGKLYFRKYLHPALVSLNFLLSLETAPNLPVLRRVAAQSLELLPGAGEAEG